MDARRPPAASLSLSPSSLFSLSLGGFRWLFHDAADNDDSSLAESQLTIRVFSRGRRISKASETGFLIRSTVVHLARG